MRGNVRYRDLSGFTRVDAEDAAGAGAAARRKAASRSAWHDHVRADTAFCPEQILSGCCDVFGRRCDLQAHGDSSLIFNG